MMELKENLPVLIVLAGLQGTGKTTLAKCYQKNLTYSF